MGEGERKGPEVCLLTSVWVGVIPAYGNKFRRAKACSVGMSNVATDRKEPVQRNGGEERQRVQERKAAQGRGAIRGGKARRAKKNIGIG